MCDHMHLTKDKPFNWSFWHCFDCNLTITSGTVDIQKYLEIIKTGATTAPRKRSSSRKVNYAT